MTDREWNQFLKGLFLGSFVVLAAVDVYLAVAKRRFIVLGVLIVPSILAELFFIAADVGGECGPGGAYARFYGYPLIAIAVTFVLLLILRRSDWPKSQLPSSPPRISR
jgi:hypothetical protein